MSHLKYLKLDRWMKGRPTPRDEHHKSHYERCYPCQGETKWKDGVYLITGSFCSACFFVVNGLKYGYKKADFKETLRHLNAMEFVGSTDKLLALKEAEMKYLGGLREDTAERVGELFIHRSVMGIKKSFVMRKKALRALVKQRREDNERRETN